MKLQIKNIGKIKETKTSIEFDGITLIAGKNNTGKSTISKILYCIFDAVQDIEKKAKNFRINSIINEIATYDMFQTIDENSPIVKNLLEKNDLIEIENLLTQYYKHLKEIKKVRNKFEVKEKEIEEKAKVIKTINEKPKTEYFKQVILKRFENEFFSQINSLYNEEKGEIELEIKKEINKLEFSNNKIINYLLKTKIEKEIQYYDGPQIINDIDWFDNYHSEKFFNRIKKEKKQNNKFLKIAEKYSEVFKCFDDLQLIFDKFLGDATINNKDFKEPLVAQQLSQGLKTIALLRSLFESDFLEEEKNLLILDEPEINLHPELQIKLAEILVILQKECDLTIMISTHSPYFLAAIDTFSYKYEIEKKCHYYYAQNDENKQAIISDVTNDVDKIYNELSKPFEDLLLNRKQIIEKRKQ